MQLLPYQEVGVDFLRNNPMALLADVMGLGKTAQAIMALYLHNHMRFLIVCPASLKLNWKRELDMWGRGDLPCQIINGTKAVIDKGSPFTIINYDIISKKPILDQLKKMRFEVGIFDESHYLKGRTSKRTKAVLGSRGIASLCHSCWFMTGTPVLNRPIELYPLLKACIPYILKEHNALSYDAFARKFCGAYWDGYTLQDKGASNIEELNTLLVDSGFMLRRTKAEVLPQLPEKRYQLIPMDAPTQKIKDLVAREFAFGRREASYQSLGIGGDEIALLRREIAEAKVQTALELIKNELQAKEKMVVFAYHRSVLERLSENLEQTGYGNVLNYGKTPPKRRQENVDTFQTKDNDCRVFLGQITAAGVGITLTAADQVLFVESSWVPGEIDQAVDRVHRIGQDKSVLIQFLVLTDSLEEHMLKTVIEKRRVVSQILLPSIFS